MIGFQEWLDSLRKSTKVLFRALTLLWKAAPRETIFLAAAILLQGLVPALSIWISKLVVDTVAAALTQGENLGQLSIGILVIGWVGAFLLDFLLNPWVQAVQGNINDKLTAHISLRLMHKADTFADLSRFEDPEFYNELQILQKEVSYQPLNLLQNLAGGGQSFITLVAMIVLLVPLGFWIPLVIAIAAIPQIVVSFQYETKIWLTLFENSPQARRMQYCTSVMLTDAYAKEVRLFKTGSFFIGIYLQAFQSLHRSMRHLRQKQALWTTGLALISTLGNGFAFFWVVQQAFRRQVSPGSVLLFVESLAALQRNLEEFVKASLELYETLLYMQQFFNFLDTELSMPLCIPGRPVPDMIHSGITFDKVHFRYPDNRLALIDISFTLYPHQTVAIVGENGAGKSTLVKLLTRLYDPTEGAILIDGVDLRELNLDDWRQQIAVVFQDFGRYAITLGENVALGDLKALEHPELLRHAIEKAGMLELVEKFSTQENTPLGKQFGGTELSGGEWQKLALSRAFVRTQAQLLILDEPTAALDPRSEYEVYHRFVELAKGKTTLLITHRLASVRMADRILVLKAGRLIEQGTHQELLQREGEYATLWNMQAKNYNF
ncbi:ABC-type multidrug transport system, ATPase and permease component [Cylindrospermum stagnale PCC 7417]|uniref:ABC-type multidrug transport system, ATPase and permease component n=1 Tax=Cylindrospermum stagnale PCC 7417 TaxID=56107 RepID=K9X3E7_9NOST|nr:ABC transporter ATP-binding protein [Cylindrospermum stagnale]AFZ26604.1 ABC-type multidrug transport system, ATPase and permease component [Cylindrospermum stagnale PCC 7417]